MALLELVIVCPVLIALLLGAAEYGRLCYVGMEVTNAAHAGVEYGTQNRVLAQDMSTIQTVSLNEEGNIANMNVPSPLTASSVTVQQLCANTYSNTPGACSTTAPNPVEYVQVNTQVTVDSLFHPYGYNGTYTLHGSAIMRVRD
jgi:Flp pilus assembly protein TadG